MLGESVHRTTPSLGNEAVTRPWRGNHVKLARHDGRLALIDAGRGAYLTELTHGEFGEDILEAIERWDELEDMVEGKRADDFSVDLAKLGPPLPLPRQVFGIGMNYRDHAIELEIPEDKLPRAPIVFTMFPTSTTGPYATVELPSTSVDFEAELVVVIKDHVENVAEADAWQHVAGFMVGNDLSERAVQMAGPVPQYSMGKSYKGFSPMGPAIVSLSEVDAPDALEIGCRVGDEILQCGSTKDLLFTIPELIAWISAICPLLPGDVIWTGTPAGVGLGRTPQRMLAPGETLTTWIAGVGEIVTHLTAGPTYPHD